MTTVSASYDFSTRTYGQLTKIVRWVVTPPHMIEKAIA